MVDNVCNFDLKLNLLQLIRPESQARTPDVTTDFVIDFATALWLGFIGACIGSFLNVVAYRMPLGMSVIWQSSHCPKCKHAIRSYDNVPVLGWLWLRGRCRDCSEPISPRYAIVEFSTGLAFFILAYVELFSGGANLPGGSITEFKGALDNVWHPQWAIISVYAWHCLLVSILITLCLFRWDKHLSNIKFIAWSSLVLLAWFALPYLLAR